MKIVMTNYDSNYENRCDLWTWGIFKNGQNSSDFLKGKYKKRLLIGYNDVDLKIMRNSTFQE